MGAPITRQHQWVGATHVPLNDRQARYADNRGSVRVAEEVKLEVLEVYCLSADTEFLTRDGVMTFGDAVGTTQAVLTQHFAQPGASRRDGRWVEASIESFGEQPLLTVTLTRSRVRKTIRATAAHRWFASRGTNSHTKVAEVTTRELAPGMVLASLTPRDGLRQSLPSPFGIAHGIVYGDGSRKNQRGSTAGTGTYVDLWGEKNAPLLRYFNDAPTSPMKVPASGLDGIRVRDLPSAFKDAPSLDESVPYLYGWLAGYFAADGCVDKTGAPTMASARVDDLHLVRRVANRLGIVTYGIRTAMRRGYGSVDTPLHTMTFDRSTLRPEFFLIPEHRQRFEDSHATQNRLRWTVEAVEDHGDVEEVFCAVVPDTHTFALADYIWTHNCVQCKRVYDDAPPQCAAATGTEHLRGGPIGVRQSRKHPWHDCDLYRCTERLPPGFGRGPVAPPQSDERHRRRAVSA